MSDDPPSFHRLQSALAAFIQQEFSAPISAIQGFTEILLEDAQRENLVDLIPDLDNIRLATTQILTLMKQLLDPQVLSARAAGADFDEFRRNLRHDLRTPINAIKGYGEMLIEDAEGTGAEALVEDLLKMLDAASQLLSQIDDLVNFGDGYGSNSGQASGNFADISVDLVANVLETIRPVSTTRIHRQTDHSRILVVDDTKLNRELLMRRLRREGHEVDVAASGREALDRIKGEEFDLILLDLMMPGMNGFEVLRHLKADDRTGEIPVIMISALDEIDSIARCIEAGAEDYLPKPFNPVILRARIGACLEKKRLRDHERAMVAELRDEKEKSESLLLNILPKGIVTRMRSGETAIADRFDDVTILFCDIVGFSNLASDLSAGEVIDLLNHLFSGFDRLTGRYGLEKIKTIGDAYMVAGGVPEPRLDHAAAVARMALAMQDVVQLARASLSPLLQIRIGIHTGMAVAGVIGTHKFAYDVWGDTVNIASRMESSALPGSIQISEATYQRLKEDFICDLRGTQEIKGKGPMETFLLVGERDA